MNRPIAARCPHCGAPASSGNARCEYCGNELVRAPEPIPSARTSSLPPATVVGLALAGLVLVIGAGFVFSSSQQASHSSLAPKPAASGAKASEIARIELSEAADRIAARFGTTASKANVTIPIVDSDFERIALDWDEPGHVTRIYLGPRGGRISDAFRESLRAQLGRSFRAASSSGDQLALKGVSMSVSSSVTLAAHSRSDPRWKSELGTCWQAVAHAAFGVGAPLDLRARREVLNLDNELADLAKIRFETLVDQRQSEVRKVFPAAWSAGTDEHVGLGHPWFENATLDWEKRSAGSWSHMNLYFWQERAKKTDLEPVRRCLDPLLGSPNEREADHVAGRVTLDWPARAGFPRVYVSHQLVMLFREKSTRASGWQRVITELASCK